MKTPKPKIVINSPIGEAELDYSGSAISSVRLNPVQSYLGIPLLLKEVINQQNNEAWTEIITKIDYTYDCLASALDSLEVENSYYQEIKSRIARGQKLLFKPNLVAPTCIDRRTHGPGPGEAICTPWPFIAALMRWFHDRMEISYHQMSIGDAGSAMSAIAAAFTRNLSGDIVITTEALIEGRSGDFYGGWGFYFVRRYLVEKHDPTHHDDPWKGYDESVSGIYLPPGQVDNKLMVYDLNRIADDPSKGRDLDVEHGVNFKTITLHKVIVGGDPNDSQDCKDYPGCILINVPKLKVHDQALLTGAIKNLGIGLYPMEANCSDESGKIRWQYAIPHIDVPGMKGGIPHCRWIAEIDENTLMPRRNKDGQYLVNLTDGMPATMADIIEAVNSQDIFTLHIIDAIETTSGSNIPQGHKRVSEGYIFTGLDPLALDLLCARYLFKTIPMAEARKIQHERNLSAYFLQKVPIPNSDGRNIITEEGVDSPITRYTAFQYFQERGLGQLDYHIVGWDKWHEGSLASLQGHLGRLQGGVFSELLTSEMYFAIVKPLWDLQATALAYFAANDSLTGSSYKQSILADFDENGDGIIDYDDNGKKGWQNVYLFLGSYNTCLAAMDIGRFKFYELSFLMGATQIKCTEPKWNPYGYDFAEENSINEAITIALAMSQARVNKIDPFFPDMTWGKGKWPSLQYARYLQICRRLYGSQFPHEFDLASLYGFAFHYADVKWGDSKYTGATSRIADRNPISQYHNAVANEAIPLPFVLYVPPGYGEVETVNIINVSETDDPVKIFTAEFDHGSEAWCELSLLSIQ